MRLIDADVIEKFLDDFADSCGNHQKAVLREVKYALGHMPTVEAEPVKHGHWVDTNESEKYGLDPELAICKCDQCGETIYVHFNDPHRWNYCPQCGSKMSEEVLIKLKRAKMDEVTE